MRNGTPQTIVAWISFLKGNGANIIDRSPTSTGPQFAIFNSGAVNLAFLSTFATTTMQIRGNEGANFEVWIPVAYTWDGSDLARKVQLFSKLTECTYSLQTSGVGAITDNSGIPVRIGNLRAENAAINGMIAHVQAFNKVLSARQIAQASLYPGSVLDGLVAYWPLWGESNLEPDLSGNRYHGTVIGAVKGFSDPPISGIYVPRVYRFPYTTPPVITTVTFDAASSSGYEPALSSYTWQHTVANQDNRLLVVGIGVFALGTVTGITFNGVPLTKLRADANGIYRSEIWYLKAPPVGTYTIEVTLDGSLTSIGNAASYYGVDQTTPIEAQDTAQGTNTPASASVLTNLDNDLVFGNLVAQTAAGVTSGGGQNSRTSNNGALGTDASDDKGLVSPAGVTTLTWNGLGALDAWVIGLAAISSIQTPAPPVPSGIIIPSRRRIRMMMGVGL